MVQQVVYTQAQFIVSKANLFAALGIPPDAALISVQYDNNANMLTVTAQQQVSTSGTP
jgi:hypothetical protein